MNLRTKLRERKLKRRLEDAPYPIHGRTLGYCGSPREPYTWFVCNHGHREMGTPWAKPDRDCRRCGWRWNVEKDDAEEFEFIGWEVADSAAAFAATMDAVGPNKDGRAAERYLRTQS